MKFGGTKEALVQSQ